MTGSSVGSTAEYLAVSRHQAAQLAVLPDISRCLHARLLSWQYCRLSRGVSTPACSVLSTAGYLAVPYTMLISWQLFQVRSLRPAVVLLREFGVSEERIVRILSDNTSLETSGAQYHLLWPLSVHDSRDSSIIVCSCSECSNTYCVSDRLSFTSVCYVSTL